MKLHIEHGVDRRERAGGGGLKVWNVEERELLTLTLMLLPRRDW